MKILKHLYKYLWIYTTILLLIFIVIIKILEMNNLAFRIYILITMTIIIIIGYIISFIRFYKKSNNEVKYNANIILALLTIYLIFYWKGLLLLYSARVPNEEEYTLNEKRYIVHTGGFLTDTEIVIYEYINDFVYKIPSLYTDFVSGGYDSIYNIYNYVPDIPQ